MRALACLLLVGCIEPFPTAFTVHAVAEAPPGKSFTYTYQPWSPEMLVVARTDTAVLTNLEGVRLSCANNACETHPDGHTILLKTRPPGDRIEIIVEKEGFETAHVPVPISPDGRGLRELVVVLRPKGAS